MRALMTTAVLHAAEFADLLGVNVHISGAEYKALGSSLRAAEAEQVWPAAVAAARFLALTGWRTGEALELRWCDLDIDRCTATLPDTKTGRSMRPLSQAAC